MLQALGGWTMDSRTLVERAKERVKKAEKRHQQALLYFAKAIYKEIPDVILEAADLARGRIAWDMSTSECFKLTSLEKKHFLLGKDNLSADEWRYVFDTVVAQLKTEPDIGWKNYDPDTPSTIVLIWNV
jgi:hypothetical protein